MEIRARNLTVPIITDPKKSAEMVGLRYVSDLAPGIRRVGQPQNFRYQNPDGSPLRDQTQLRRIKSLAIPPAWTNVWICPVDNGHLQATGRDARGRKQYRYHPQWRSVRDDTKFTRMILFGKALPRIRERVEKDLQVPGLQRRKVLATVIRLIEKTFIRVGNEEYARENKSYGLTTLRNHHAKIKGEEIQFTFRGKSSKQHNISLHAPRIARILKKCQDLPGQDLLQYIDSDGQVQDVKSEDVNDYLREISGHDFTAKDFRTWAGTVLAARALRQCEPCVVKRQIKKNMTSAVESVADRLGNTPAVCRKCYVHPAVFDAYQDGSIAKLLPSRKHNGPRNGSGLTAEEAGVLCLLEARLKRDREPLENQLRRSLAKVKLHGRRRSVA